MLRIKTGNPELWVENIVVLDKARARKYYSGRLSRIVTFVVVQPTHILAVSKLSDGEIIEINKMADTLHYSIAIPWNLAKDRLDSLEQILTAGATIYYEGNNV